MKTTDFEVLAGLLKKQSGLALTEDKVYLLESRLNPVARRFDFESLEDLVAAIRTTRPADLVNAVTEAMTTNESFFFRDGRPFEILEKEVLPRLVETHAGKCLRIWSAACSTGQEAYSIAMILKDMRTRFAGWRIEIVGTDISNEVLEKAKAGLYTQFEVQRGLPIQMLMRNFKQVSELWQIDGALRAMVQYREFNLLDDFRALGTFDVIFCRNVLIYFDPPTKAMVLEKMCRALAPDGCLFLGAAETVLGISNDLHPVPGLRGVYSMAA